MTDTPAGGARTNGASMETFVRRALVTRLLAEQNVAELSHLPLGLLAIGLTWRSVAPAAQFTWFALLLTATLIRMVVRRRVQSHGSRPEGLGALRAAIVGVAAVWGLGLLIAAPNVNEVEAALLLVMICGLTAAATSTLLADALTYGLYTGGLLVFTALGVLRLADRTDFRIAFIIVVFYGGVMAALYSRLRKILLESLHHEFDLDASRRSADRERAYLDQLIASAPDAVVVVDEAHRIVRANTAFETLFGYSLGEARDRPLDELILPAGEALRSPIQSQLAEGRTVQVDARRRRKDGSEFDVRISASRIPGHVDTLAIYHDITEQKNSERALRDSELRLFRTLASLPVGIMVIDPSGLPFFVNDAAKDLLGKGIVEANDVDRLARTYRAYVAGTDQLYPADRMPIVRALDGEETKVDDMEIRRPDGTINIEVFGSPIRDAQGRVIFGVAAFTDITERRRIAEALRFARVAAEEATASKSAFLANMSHEIRTPLNGILGMAELLLDGSLSADDRRSVQLILSSGETLLRVINDILDFSKIEAGQLDIEHTEVDLPVLVESTASLLAPKAASSGVEMVTDIEPGVPPRVISDPTRLRQVLANLVGNAVKFTHGGEVVITVTRIGGDDHAAQIRFAVRDTGIGIAADKLSGIFGAFRQADATTTRRYGGTGLGLSISRRLVELMGGELTAESTEGVGSTFSFVLTLPIPESAEVAAVSRADLKGARVLIVDDNATNRRAMRATLEAVGSDVSESADATTGLRELRDAARSGHPFAAVVSDLLMPGVDGFDMATEVRGDPPIAATPIIMATSVHRRGDSRRSRELGIAAFLLKPVSRDDLIEALRLAVGRETPSRGMPSVSRSTAAADAPTVRPLRVLLAEDNAVNQEVAMAILRRRGHAVDVVGNGRAAVDAAAAHEYDVILMDLQMPEMDGLEATAAIRATPRGANVRIIALTANAMAGERERCLAAGLDDYLSKPFRASDLAGAVERREVAASGASTDGHFPPVDLHGLKSDLELGGVAEILPEIIGTFVSDVPGRMEALRAAVAGGESRTIERAAHAFKSGAATIRARALADLLQALEREARAGEVKGAAERLAAIEAALAAVQRQLAESGEFLSHE